MNRVFAKLHYQILDSIRASLGSCKKDCQQLVNNNFFVVSKYWISYQDAHKIILFLITLRFIFCFSFIHKIPHKIPNCDTIPFDLSFSSGQENIG
jgi:hypothetical protein